MGRLLRLIAIALAVTLLAAIQGAQCDEGQVQPAPTEYECRPYIEKALQGLANPEATADVIGDAPAADEGTEDPEGTRQKRSTDDGSSEESSETQPEEANITSDEETVTPTEEQAPASEEEGVPTEEQAPASEEEGMPTTEEMPAVEGTTVEETSSEELSAAEGDATIEETSSEEVVPTADDDVPSNEDSEPSIEEIATGAEESEPSAEEGSGEVAEAEVPEVDDSGSSEESSMEVMQGDAPTAEEAEQTVESTESAEESTENAGEQTAESAESTEQADEESAETTENTAEKAVEPSEQTADESVESTEQAAEDSVESPEQPEGESAESTEQGVAEGETAEQITEGETTDEATAVEESEESIEQGEVSEPTEETAESIESTESAEQGAEEPAAESAESTEQADQAAEEASASEESTEQAADVEAVEGEAVQVEAIEAEAIEGDAAEVEADEGVATVGEAASEGSGEKAAVEEAAIEATEEATLDAVQEDEVEAEPTPEEELSFEVEIPENLRPREHIAQILRLDEESIEDELLVGKTVDTTLKDLKRFYDTAIKPLEILYKYRDLSNRHFGDPEIFSKPLILFMGPWSGGKSSIINYLLDNEYKRSSLRTGAEPSPAYFNILMHGEREEVLDGTQLAADWTFSGLQKFGQGLLDRLRGLRLNNRLLEKVNIVEIPGILEIRKQVERLFPFNDACQWFIDRADIIFLVYDPAKLDVGPETEAILDQLKGREYQTRIVLNKADQVRPEELMRVQGTLIWNISPLMSSTQPPVMYSTSLWSMPYELGAPLRLLRAQERAFLRDMREAIDRRVENKISSARRFAVRVRNHAKMVDCYLTTYYNHKSFFGNRKKVADDIIEKPQDYHIYEGLSTLTNISRYDLPDPETYRDFFRVNPLYEFELLSATCTYFKGCPINRLDVAIAYDLPELVGKYKKAAEIALETHKKS